MNRRFFLAQARFVALSLMAGCATVDAPLHDAPERHSAEARYCADWFRRLDDAIDGARVRDAGAHPVPGFPYLRVDRLLASFKDDVAGDAAAFNAWIVHMQGLDAQARHYELKNLPQQAVSNLKVADRRVAEAQTRVCAAWLAREDLASAARRRLLIARAKVADDYSDWKRGFGFYALTRIAFMKRVEAWQTEVLDMFKRSRATAAAADQFRTYSLAGTPVSADRIAAIYSRLKTDALGVPQLSAQDRDTLFRAYAPVYEVQTTGAYDRFGPLYLKDGDPAPAVDVTRPVAYTRLAFTRYRGQILVQLVYAVWFPERPSGGIFDLLAGKLDGVVLRVTLGTDGAPLIYDTMHPCGCFHMFFPAAGVKPRAAPKSAMEWAFVPLRLPAMAPAQRVVVRIESRTHYVVDVRPNAGAGGAMRYELADDNELRAIAVAPGVTRSAFGPDGIVAGTERGERFMFWPMGIDNPGAMRQWGRQATAFVGRRHFDDAYLIEQRFEPSLAGAPEENGEGRFRSSVEAAGKRN